MYCCLTAMLASLWTSSCSIQNEDVLKKCAQEYLSRVRKEEQRYQALKIHAEEKLDKWVYIVHSHLYIHLSSTQLLSIFPEKMLYALTNSITSCYIFFMSHLLEDWFCIFPFFQGSQVGTLFLFCHFCCFQGQCRDCSGPGQVQAGAGCLPGQFEEGADEGGLAWAHPGAKGEPDFPANIFLVCEIMKKWKQICHIF